MFVSCTQVQVQIKVKVCTVIGPGTCRYRDIKVEGHIGLALGTHNTQIEVYTSTCVDRNRYIHIQVLFLQVLSNAGTCAGV